jgi:DNA-binding NtrC family response regulator
VLIIDDEPDVLDYFEEVLHPEGLAITILSDPSVVVRRLHDELFHIVLLDLMMPKIDGLRLLAQIRAFDEDISVIMVSGYASVETVSASTELGISAFLLHPITPVELRDAIARIVKKKALAPRGPAASGPRPAER